MLLANTQKLAAKQFVKNWTGRGYEKGETQRFWLELLHNVFGIDNPIATPNDARKSGIVSILFKM